MTLRLIDLRKAAMHEYPELSDEPVPLTWWQVNCWWVVAVSILYLDVLLVIVVTIAGT